MSPTISAVYNNAYKPFNEGNLSLEQAYDAAQKPIKAFMLKQTRQKDIALFLRIAKQPNPQNEQQLGLNILVPAFIISELKTAFEIGFLLYIPFVIIDIVVSSVLMSMGMMMLPPVMISLPFKLLLFVLADGWNLVVLSLVKSFH
jgi:flagellar biosynthetic protein FliP